MANEYIRKGDNAKRLLDDPAFRDATDSIERQIVEKLKASLLDGKPETERYALELVRCLQAHARMQKQLWVQVENGKLAEHDLDRKTFINRRGL